MDECKNFIRSDLGNGYVICEDVHLPSGSTYTVYFSPNGIYALSDGTCSPAKRYQELEAALKATRIRLYCLDTEGDFPGFYDPETDQIVDVFHDEALVEDINAWLQSGHIIYHESTIERMIDYLNHADIQARGYATCEDGSLLLLRHGRLYPASSLSSDTQYYLTLFGGTLGLHRFYAGKIFSGILYLFTGGFFLVGWLSDLLQLFAGVSKDRKKRYLFPLSKLKYKLFALLPGLIAGIVLFLVYVSVCDMFGLGLQNMFSELLQNADPSVIQNISDTVTGLAGN